MPIDSESQSSGPQALAPVFRRPQVSPLQPLEIEGDRADNWKIWKQSWQNYCIITGLHGLSIFKRVIKPFLRVRQNAT